MKNIILTLTLLGSLSANATQIFHCKGLEAGHQVDLAINSFTEVEYATDWDFDGTYGLFSFVKGAMWNTFKSVDSNLEGVELQIQGKLFHGKPGLVKEVVYDATELDGKRVSVFKCAPGQLK